MTTIFDNEERADLRRTLDGDMTSGILGIINPLAKSCALAVALQLTDRANAADNVIKYHYLKGGNAISILANQPTTGDYDFQVVPTQATYQAWEKSAALSRNPDLPYDLRNTNFAEMHRSVIQVLLDSAKVLEDVDLASLRQIEGLVDLKMVGKLYNLSKNTVDKLIEDAPSVARVAYELADGTIDDQNLNYQKKLKIISEGRRALAWNDKNVRYQASGGPRFDANYGNNSMILTEIGKRYLDYSESELLLALDSEKHVGGRIKLDTKTPGAVLDTPFYGERYQLYCMPTVYVNCTIPGFLLYRLALIYEFVLYEDTLEEAQSIKIKSEVVDISIPRLLSAESELSTKDQVSIVSDKGGFMIPGWRYHLFENLLLLGEIPLGISGSEHKKAKRQNRVIEALSHLHNPAIPYLATNGPLAIPPNISSAFVDVLFDRYIDDSRDRNLVDPAVIAAAMQAPSYFAQFAIESFYLAGDTVNAVAMDGLLDEYLAIAKDKFLQLATAVVGISYNGFAGIIADTVEELTSFTIFQPLSRCSELLSACLNELGKKPSQQDYVVAGALSGLVYRLLMAGIDAEDRSHRFPLKRIDIETNTDVYTALNGLTAANLTNISNAMPGNYSVTRLPADNEVALKVIIDEGINNQGVCWLFSFRQRANNDFTDLENLPNQVLASGGGVQWYLPRLLDSRSVLQAYMQKISIIELRYPLMDGYKELTKVASDDPTQVGNILNGNYAKAQQEENDRRLAKAYEKYLADYH